MQSPLTGSPTTRAFKQSICFVSKFETDLCHSTPSHVHNMFFMPELRPPAAPPEGPERTMGPWGTLGPLRLWGPDEATERA